MKIVEQKRRIRRILAKVFFESFLDGSVKFRINTMTIVPQTLNPPRTRIPKYFNPSTILSLFIILKKVKLGKKNIQPTRLFKSHVNDISNFFGRNIFDKGF